MVTVLADLVLQIDFVVRTKQLRIVAEEDQPQSTYMSHENKTLIFHYTGIGILTMVYCNPHIAG